jgi:predicted nucleic acid-binding protein
VIIIDTNVLSELMKPAGEPAVVEWVRSRPREDLFTTAVTVAEVMYGLEVMPPGRKRDTRLRLATAMFDVAFAHRLLPFDDGAARAFAVIAADRRRAGRPIQTPDAQIAAIARANRMSVATRNVKDFADCGVDLIDPWEG